MPPDDGILEEGGLAVLVLYLLLLLGIGVFSRLARREESLSDFYLGGRSLGPAVLFLTLYATQYSGLTLVGFPGNVYRSGFSFLVAVTFACAVIGGYLWIAPRLHQLSQQRRYITVGDFLADRYGSRRLNVLATCVFLFALGAYVMSNLKAIGYVVEAATGGSVSPAVAIVGLALLMLVCESLGGMRAVAWTDALQGSLLLVGCVVVFIAVLVSYGGLEPSSAKLAVLNPEFFVAPNAQGKLRWASTLLLVGAGVSIYPHAIQRIYAARDARTLRRSLQWMLLMPFATSLLVLTIGLIGAAQFPGLDRKGSEEIVLIVMQELARSQPALQAVVVMLVCAIVAAIMSTIDSAMLAISSLLTRDFYAILRPEANQSTLTRFGRRISWLLMAALAALAITLPQTLWRITEIKLELLCQVAPAIYLGLHGTALRARPVLAGLVTGLLITVLLDTSEWLPGPSLARPLGIHAGIWGLAANLLVTVAMQSAGARKAPGRAELSAG